VGSGTWDQRPGTCTEGVGYWVTDRGSWNTSAGTDGYHNPLGYTGQGQLYRCGASNNWVLYYTPYTYPHPLQDTGTAIPIISSVLPQTTNACDEATWPSTVVSLSWTTDMAATCKYDTVDVAYASMAYTAGTTGSYSHSQSLTLNCGESYAYYIRCSSTAGVVNTTSETIVFKIDNDPRPPKQFGVH